MKSKNKEEFYTELIVKGVILCRQDNISGKKFTFPKYVLYTLEVDADEWEGKENGKGRMDKENK